MTNEANKEDFALFLEEIGVTPAQLDAVKDTLPDPLPKKDWEPWTLKDSSLHGKGLFSTINANQGCPLAILKTGSDWTEAGMFANHSGDPNTYAYRVGDTIMLEAFKPIVAGDELVVDYRDVKDAVDNANSRWVVYDDFCADPEAVVASVKRAGFATWLPSKGLIGTSIYEGMGFWGDHAFMLKALVERGRAVIVPNTMFFRVTNKDTEAAYIHSDRETGKHTCVCYLSEHDDDYGTAFYRHIPTGLLEMPSFLDQQILGLDKQLAKDMVDRNPDHWEMVAFVKGKYNRAVSFWAPLFHSRIPVTGFGSEEEAGRLVWVSHFYKLNGSGELY